MELEAEIEALQAIYADELTVQLAGSESGATLSACCAAEVQLQLMPRGAEAHNAFVLANLRLRVPAGYPADCAEVVDVSLTDTKGLGDARATALERKLREEAVALQGELVLGTLCELALDLVTEENRPEGGSGRWHRAG